MIKLIIFPLVVLIMISLLFFTLTFTLTSYSLTDKLSLYQTILGVFGLLLGYVGVHEIIKKLNLKFNMEFQVDGKKRLDITEHNINNDLNISFYIANTGDFSIKKNEIYYHIRCPKSFCPKSFERSNIAGIQNEIPKLNNIDFDKNIIVISGEIPVNIYPKRKFKIFTLKVRVTEPGEYVLKYYFSTEQGFVPNTVIARDDPSEPTEGLGELKINIKTNSRSLRNGSVQAC